MSDSSGSSGGGLPSKPPAPGGGLPARRLSTQELEAVIRRAVELQSGAAGTPDEGISEGEVIRIGQELGLDPATVRRAITDVRGRPPEERGVLAKTMGPGSIRAARTVRRPAAMVGLLVEEYLLKCEYMVVQRRFADRTRYVRATGFAAAVGRGMRVFRESHAAMDLPRLDVSVSALDDESCLVEVSVEMAGARAGMAAGAVATGGSVAAGIASFALATTIADPVALLGLPALMGTWAGFRGIYGAMQRSTQEKLESFLDRLEHNELKVPTPRMPWSGGGGFNIGGGFGGIRIGPGRRE